MEARPEAPSRLIRACPTRSIGLLAAALASVAALTACGSDGPTGPPAEPYVYAAPPEIGDGWATGDAVDEGISVDFLEEMVDRIRQGRYVNIHSVLLIRKGKLVFEEYFAGRSVSGAPKTYRRETRHEQHSVTKSVTSLLAGIAVDQGLIESLDTPLYRFFPDHPAFENERKRRISLRHVLSMTAGLAWDEHTYWYTDSRNDHVAMNQSGDPIEFVLGLEAEHEPGTVFTYNSGLPILFGELLRRVSGVWAHEFADEHLFGRLGFEPWYWWRYPDGTVQLGGGLSITPRDMAKLGQLVLDDGLWQGERVISEEWIEESTALQTNTDGPTWTYGYYWWRRGFAAPWGGQESVHAWGRGGQYIFLFDELDLVAVFTGGNDNNDANQPFEMVERYVLPAILDRR